MERSARRLAVLWVALAAAAALARAPWQVGGVAGARAGSTLAVWADAAGARRLVAGASNAFQASGALYAVDPRTGDSAVLAQGDPESRLGLALASCDLDGDGRLDLVAGAPGGPNDGAAGSVRVWWSTSQAWANAPSPEAAGLNALHVGRSLACLSAAGPDWPGVLLVGSGDDDVSTAFVYLARGTTLDLLGRIEAAWDESGGRIACGGSLTALRLVSGAPRVYVGCAEASRALWVDLTDPLVDDGRWEPKTLRNLTAPGFGAWVEAIGDFDGDGLDDLAIGSNEGGIFVYDEDSEAPRLTLPQALVGVEKLSVIRRLGDVNGDGYADFAVSGTKGSATAVRVVFGRPDGSQSAPEVLGIDAPADCQAFGADMVGLGDVDGDGLADRVVGCPGNSAVALYVGTPTLGVPRPTRFSLVPQGGVPIAAGDVDGDGFADILWTWLEDGVNRQAVQRGIADGLESALTPITLPTELQQTTRLAAAAGDLDGDGLADVALAFPEVGRVLIRYGGNAPLAEVQAPAEVTGFGLLAAGVGDLDDDGYDDLAVAGRLTSSGALRAFVFRGGARGAGWAVLARLPGPAAATEVLGVAGLARTSEPDVHGLAIAGNDAVTVHWWRAGGVFGEGSVRVPAARGVSGPWDFDSDGRDDLLVAAQEAGIAQLLLMPDEVSSSIGVVEDTLAVAMGANVFAVGDFAGTGRRVVVSRGEDTSRLWLDPLEPWPLLWQPEGSETGRGALPAAALGDLNGDGFDDFGFVELHQGQQWLDVYFGGQQAEGRPYELTQSFAGVERLRGYVSDFGAVALGAVVRDELGAVGPLGLEVQVVSAGADWSGAQTAHTEPSLERTMAWASFSLGSGDYRWRARVVSPMGLTGRWRYFGPPRGADFTITIGSQADGGATQDGGGDTPDAGGDVGVADGGGDGPGEAVAFEARACGCGAGAGAAGGLALVLALWLLGERRRRHA